MRQQVNANTSPGPATRSGHGAVDNKEVKPRTAPAFAGCEPLTVRIPEAVRLIGLCRSTLYELLGSGEIECIKVGRCTLILMESLREFVQARRR